MLSLETYPAFYLGYVNAYHNASTFKSYPTSLSGGSSSELSGTSIHNRIPCRRRDRGPSATPYECGACGVPLRLFRQCCNLQLTDNINMTAHLCITTYRSPNNEVLKLELCFVGQDCQRIPSILGATYGLQTKRLDLSYNAIRSLEGLEKFPQLEELILDNNFIDDTVIFPRLDSLQTFSLNKNKVSNLEKFLDQVGEKFPNLRYLSLLGNEACPNQLSSLDKDEQDYKRYRLYVLHRLHSLRFLDSTPVRKSEVREARKRGGLMKVVKPPAPPPPQPLSAQNSNAEADNHIGNNHQEPLTKNQTQNGSAVKKGESPDPSQTQPSHTGAFGVRRHRYIGKHSEGNRFISNEHL